MDVCGLATDYCVKATALDAINLGFPTRLLAFASRGVNINPEDSEKACAEVRSAGGEIVETESQTPNPHNTPSREFLQAFYNGHKAQTTEQKILALRQFLVKTDMLVTASNPEEELRAIEFYVLINAGLEG